MAKLLTSLLDCKTFTTGLEGPVVVTPDSDLKRVVIAGLRSLSEMSVSAYQKLCQVRLPNSDTMVSFKLARRFTVAPGSLITDQYRVEIDPKYANNKKAQKAVIGAGAIVLLLLGLNALGANADTKSAQSLIDEPTQWLPVILSKTSDGAMGAFNFLSDSLCTLLQCTVTVAHFAINTMFDILVALTHLVCLVVGAVLNIITAVVKIAATHGAVAKYMLVIAAVSIVAALSVYLAQQIGASYLRVGKYVARNYKRPLCYATQLSDVACTRRADAWFKDGVVKLSPDNLAYGELNSALVALQEISSWYTSKYSRSFGYRYRERSSSVDSILKDEGHDFNYVVATLNAISIVLQHYVWHFAHLHRTTSQMDDAIRFCLAVQSEVIGNDFSDYEDIRHTSAVLLQSNSLDPIGAALSARDRHYRLQSLSL